VNCSDRTIPSRTQRVCKQTSAGAEKKNQNGAGEKGSELPEKRMKRNPVAESE